MDGVYNPNKIEVRIVSLSNINDTQSTTIVFNNITFNNSGSVYIGFNGFTGGCTK